MAGKKKLIDWERIEKPFRAGRISVLQIAAEYENDTGVSISHTAINKHFAKLGIKRDLSEKVQAKADSMVSAAMVSGRVSTETMATDAEIINAEALSVANIQFSHRLDIPKKRELVAKLFSEIEAQTDNADFLEQARLALGQGDLPGLATALEKATSLPARIKGVSDLVGAYKTLISLEREAFGITVGDSKPTKAAAGAQELSEALMEMIRS